MIVDFNYVREEQKSFCKALEDKKGINYIKESFNVPYWLILSLQTELGEVVNASAIHKWWSNEKVDRGHLIEELSDFLSHIGNLANFLELELVLDIEEVQVTAVETTINRLAYQITTLSLNKRQARTALMNWMIPLFVELVYSFGFNLEELSEAYKLKMSENYLRFV